MREPLVRHLALTLASTLLACGTSSPIAPELFGALSGSDLFIQALTEDCMRVMVDRFERENNGRNPRAQAEGYCEVLVRQCHDSLESANCNKAAHVLDRDRGESGASSLYQASYAGYARLVTQLLTAGFDPNAKLAGPGWPGWTPLMIAAAEGHEEIVRLLLDAGADPNAQNKLGRTSLMFASSYGNEPIARMLLDKGASPNTLPTDDTGWTALMAAAFGGRSEVVQLLLERGADKSLTDKNGRTALALAEENGDSDSIRLLR